MSDEIKKIDEISETQNAPEIKKEKKKLSKKACKKIRKKFFEKCSEKIPVNLQEAAAMSFP